MDFLQQIIHTLNQPLKMKIAKSDIMARKWCLPQINFAKEQMTSYGGLVVFKPLLERLRIAQKLDSCCRHLQAGCHYRFGRIVQLLVIHILLGFRPLRDIDFYKEDPLVRQMAGMKRLPSVPTISRMWEQFEQQSLLGLEKTHANIVLQRVRGEGVAGQMEGEETYCGGREEGLRGRETQKQALIVGAAQEDGKGIGRIRLHRVPDASADSIVSFIENAIEPGSLVKTDGWKGYAGLETKGYRHQILILSRRNETASDLLPRVHRVVSLLKRWLMGTHQGAVSHEHLDYYFAEFTFRFNRRSSRHRGLLFYRLLQQAVAAEAVPYKDLVAHCRGPRPHGYKM